MRHGYASRAQRPAPNPRSWDAGWPPRLRRHDGGFRGVKLTQHLVGYTHGRQVERDFSCAQSDDAREPVQCEIDSMQACHERYAARLRFAAKLADNTIGESGVYGGNGLIRQYQIRALIQ